MTSKTPALVRDLATLFVRYRAEDWAPLIQELETRRGSPQLADAIRALAATATEGRASAVKPRRAPKKTKPRKATTAPLEPTFSPDRASVLSALLEALRTKTALASASELKTAYQAAGLKLPMPTRREDAAVAIVGHLNALAPARFDDALRAIGAIKDTGGGAPDDYGRWIDIILKPGS